MEIIRFWALVADAFLQDAQRWADARGALLALLVWLIVLRYRLKKLGKLGLFDHLVEGAVSVALTLLGSVLVLMLSVILYYPSVVYFHLDREVHRIESERNRLEQEFNERFTLNPPSLP